MIAVSCTAYKKFPSQKLFEKEIFCVCIKDKTSTRKITGLCATIIAVAHSKIETKILLKNRKLEKKVMC